MASMVASIDFGTTFSGTAFAMADGLKETPPKIYARQWTGEKVSSKSKLV